MIFDITENPLGYNSLRLRDCVTLDDVRKQLQRDLPGHYIYKGGNHVSVHRADGKKRLVLVTETNQSTNQSIKMTKTIKLEFGFGIGKDRNQNSLSQTDVIDGLNDIKRYASAVWKGYTLIATHGGWTNTLNTLVEEPGYTLMVLASSPSRISILSTITTIKQALRQEAVCLTQTPVKFEII